MSAPKDPRRYLRLQDGRPAQNMRWGVVYAAELDLLRSHKCKRCKTGAGDGGVVVLWSWLVALMSNRAPVEIRAGYLAKVTGYSKASVRRFGVHLEHVGLVKRQRTKAGIYRWELSWPPGLRDQANDPDPDRELSALGLEALAAKAEVIHSAPVDDLGKARTGARTPEHGCAHREKDPKDGNTSPPLSPPPGVLESEVLGMLEVLVASAPVDGSAAAWDAFQVELAQSATARPAKQQQLARRLASAGLDVGYTGRLDVGVVLEAARRALDLYLHHPA